VATLATAAAGAFCDSVNVSVRRSAGLLLHRLREGDLEVLLVHPGGPFWARRDAGDAMRELAAAG